MKRTFQETTGLIPSLGCDPAQLLNLTGIKLKSVDLKGNLQEITYTITNDGKVDQTRKVPPTAPALPSNEIKMCGKDDLSDEKLIVEDQEEGSGNSGSMDDDSSSLPESVSKKLMKVTQAQMMGKTTGRWTKEEHKKFV